MLLSHPERIERFTDRLSELFARATVRLEDEPRGHALTGLRSDLVTLRGAIWFAELGTELSRYFSALQ